MPFYCHPEYLEEAVLYVPVADSHPAWVPPWNDHYSLKLTPVASEEATLEALHATCATRFGAPTYAVRIDDVPPEVFSALFV